MARLTQRFTNDAAYLKELERISNRWEQPKLCDDAYEIDRRDLPRAYGRIPAPCETQD